MDVTARKAELKALITKLFGEQVELNQSRGLTGADAMRPNEIQDLSYEAYLELEKLDDEEASN